MPSIDAVAIAAGAAPRPPVPMMLTNANCEPPVNISRDISCACQRSSPAATASAPKLMP